MQNLILFCVYIYESVRVLTFLLYIYLHYIMRSISKQTLRIPLLSLGLAILFTASAFAQNGDGNRRGKGHGGGKNQQEMQQLEQTGEYNNQKQGKGKNKGSSENKKNNSEKNRSTIMDPSQPISDAELIALNKMGEEEFLARDVYIALYDKWEIKSFSKISQSEQRHADKILDLTNAYSIENFSDHEIGIFHDEELQKLYTDLVAKGVVSEVEALRVGAMIEDLDIYDLENFLKDVENTDIKKVFDNLNRGSRNHMKAFISELEKRGATYTPIYITEERFLEVSTGEKEKGEGHDGEDCDHGKSEESGEKEKGEGHDDEDCDHGKSEESCKNKKETITNENEKGFFAWLWSWF